MNRSRGEKVFSLFNSIILIFLMVLCLYPFTHVLFASVSNPFRLMRHQGLILFPLGFTIKGYELVFKNVNIMTGYANTLYYVIVGTLMNMFFTALGAYVLSRKDFMLKSFMAKMIMFTMIFQGGLVPLYYTVMKLGLIDKRMAIILPTLVWTWNLMIMRTSFAQIPDSLEESAKMDGANHFTILFRIILPVSKPILSVIALYYLVGHWNSWFQAAIYLKSRLKYPLQLILREILLMDESQNMLGGLAMEDTGAYQELIKSCTIIVATLPILFVYPYLQKNFIKGIMIGSLKG